MTSNTSILRDFFTIAPWSLAALPKAPTVGKSVPKALAMLTGQALLNRSFININSLIPCTFALPENKTPARAKVSLRFFKTLTCGLVAGSSSLFAAINLPPHTPVPGGIAVLELTEQPASENENVSASYRGARVMLVSPIESQAKHWQAIVGIPLSAKPGSHQLSVISNQGVKSSITFDVKPKTYQEQRIILTNKRQVNPLTADLERINREKRLMVAAFKDWNTLLTPTLILAKPTTGPLSSPFGLRRFFNDQPRNPHSGLDIAAPEGTPIQAPAEAIVVATGDYFFNGNTVLLDHGHGLVTMFCHMSRIDVAEGDHVQLNDTIGLVGKTGRVTGAHLHWSVSLNNARIDPNLLMPKEPAAASSSP